MDNVQADDDGFDVAVEDAIADRPSKRGKGPDGRKITRQSRDKKFGFGGAGKRSKQNTQASTDNFGSRKDRRSSGGRPKGDGKRGGVKRLGKSRRMSARSKS